MSWDEFTTHDGEALIAGLRAGDGPPVLLLHGGPGLGFDYLRDLAEELAEENDVAWYQQRGQAPSAVDGPHTVATDVEDARRVVDALGWQRAYVVGHSWGGHLALHFAEAFENLIHFRGLLGVGHRMLQSFKLVVQIAKAAAAGNRLIEHGTSGHFLHVLAEISDGDLLRDGDVTLVSRLFPDDHAEKRRLAGAVRADQTDLFSGVELKRCIDEKNLAAVLLADAGKRNHMNFEIKLRAAPVSGSMNARRLAINCNGGSPSCFSLMIG